MFHLRCGIRGGYPSQSSSPGNLAAGMVLATSQVGGRPGIREAEWPVSGPIRMAYYRNQSHALAISCHAPSDAFNWCWDQRMQICGQHACQILELGLEYIVLGCKSHMLWCILCSCSICKCWPTKLDKGWCMHQTLSAVCKMLAWWAFVPWTNWVEAPDRGSRPRISSEGERS